MYMGIVRLPSIASYWSPDKSLPDHFFSKDISLFRYEMLWRCIHVTKVDVEGEGNESDDDSASDEGEGDEEDDDYDDADGAPPPNSMKTLTRTTTRATPR